MRLPATDEGWPETFGIPVTGSEWCVVAPEGLISYLETHSVRSSAQKVLCKSVDKEIRTRDYVRIGNNRIASNHSPNRPTFAASRSTICRA